MKGMESMRGFEDRGLAQLLAHRYGDGLVYLRETTEQDLYDIAVRRGFISTEGYLTPVGRSWLALHDGD